ncbi:MAG: VOC family protein [Bacillota bacterium]
MRGLNHVGVVVSNLENSIKFYENILGMTVTYRGEVPEKGLRLAFITGEGICLELLEFKEKPQNDVPLNHLAITVEEIETWSQRLKREEVSLLDKSPRTVLEGRSRIMFFTGPDGERIELHQPVASDNV